MPVALYFKPSWERLQARIHAAAPDLRVALYEQDGTISLDGAEITLQKLQPEYFWIHSELMFSSRLKDYFRLMQESDSIRWLHTVNTGLDKLPYLELVERGVMVTNNHAQAPAIAEFVFGQLLAHFQQVADYREKQQQGIWGYRGFREVAGSHWLIIGFGAIGQHIARRARAFEAEVTAVRRLPDSEGLANAVVTLERLPEVLGAADVVVLACASNAATRGLVNKAFLGAMKERSVLVNIARGDLVVEADLQAALDAGTPAFAILDVFNEEPPAPDSWIWRHERVSLTPHTSNAGSGMRKRSEENFLDNLARIVRGEPLQNQVSSRDIV